MDEKNYSSGMSRAARCAIGLSLVAGLALMGPARASDDPIVLSFIKGDTHVGSKVQLRILGDSVLFSETVYSADAAPRESLKSLRLDARRRRALHGVIGELPRYPSFGSCFGKGMRYYLVETPEGKFYRSLPERAGKCYLDEPGIFSLFQDLDDLMAPPKDLDYQELSAS